MFEPLPLTQPKKGKKIFAILVFFLWVSILVVVIWGIQIQSLNSKESDNNKTMPVIQSRQGSQLPDNQVRLDEILGSKRFDNVTGSDVETGNPTENTGSIEKLLEGKEIVVPNSSK